MQQVRPDNWTRKDFIKFYSEQWGCPCIPIRQDKKAQIKWADYQRSNPTAEQYKQWFENSSPYGIAIVMRGGLFSIDLDTDELFAKLRGNWAFPRGACIYKSRRGYHVIMKADHYDLNYPFSVPEHNDQLTKADKIIGCSITTQPGKSTYIDGEKGIVKALKDIGRNCTTIRGWNLKFDIQRLAINGLGVAAFDYDFDDGEVMAYCIGYDDLHLKNMETQELNLWHPTTEEVMGATIVLSVSSTIIAVRSHSITNTVPC